MIKLDIKEILTYLPHRYPFQLIDRILECEKGKSLTGLKNVTSNEPFFAGHFPENPVMPGVIIVEALAQAAGILIFITTDREPYSDDLYYFAGIDNVRFKKVVIPGDQLHLHVSIEKNKRDVWKFNTKATVNGEVTCTADLILAK